jgi:hypothetical protein
MMWHQARAQLSQGVADRPCVGTFPKNVLSMCPKEAMLKGSNAQGGARRKLGCPTKLHGWPA